MNYVVNVIRPGTLSISKVPVYIFKRMPLRIIHAQATFQRTLDILLSGLQSILCLLYIHVSITIRTSVTEHLKKIEAILRVLQDIGVSLMFLKFNIFVTR